MYPLPSTWSFLRPLFQICRPANLSLWPVLRQFLSPHLPSTAAADTSTARSKSVVMAHDQLRFDLLYRVHRHTDDDQQRSSAKIKVHVQTVGDPGRQVIE